MSSLEHYTPSINAYSSVIIPRDDGSITITGLAQIGSVTIGTVLTAGGPGRVTGAAPTFDATLATTALIAGSVQDAINDPANPFLAAGVRAARSGAVVELSRTNPAVALLDACSNLTVLQATLGDMAAGSLSRQVTPLHTELFAAQVIRWIRANEGARRYWNYSDAVPQGLIDPGFELHVTEDDALVLFDELDAQAEFYLGAGFEFYQLPVGPTFPATPGTQTALVTQLLAGTLAIQGDSGLTSTQMRTLAQLVMPAVKASYWLNYPEHVVWETNLGVGNSGSGTGEPVFSDAANQIANPNNRPPPFGTATFLSAFDYRKWPAPIRYGLETRWRTAQLEKTVDQAGANAEFLALTTAWNSKTLIDIG